MDWSILSLVEDSRDLSDLFGNVKFSYISRDFNRAAHQVEKYDGHFRALRDFLSWILDSIPSL